MVFNQLGRKVKEPFDLKPSSLKEMGQPGGSTDNPGNYQGQMSDVFAQKTWIDLVQMVHEEVCKHDFPNFKGSMLWVPKYHPRIERFNANFLWLKNAKS